MLGYLKGRVLENGIQSGDGTLTLGVGSPEQGFVGYSVHVPRHPGYELLSGPKPVELFIYTHVREDQLDLYGFATRLEKELFLTLLSVNGIGPKGALGILSGVEPPKLIEAIVEGDREVLTKLPGIGKKTAERVVLELAEPLKKKWGALALSGTREAKAPESSDGSSGAGRGAQAQTARDAVSALVGLGFRENDAASVVARALAESSGRKAEPRAEDLIKTALRQLA